MKKTIPYNFLLSVALCLIPFIISAVFYDKLPEQVAIHFDFSGQPNNYAPKIFVALGFPFLMLCVHLFNWFMLENDPKRANSSRTLKLLKKWLIPVVAVIIQIAIVTNAIGITFNWNFYVLLLVGIIIVIFGNYLPKCKQNYTLGIKLPWTLSDTDNWYKTHRVAGYVWIFGGFVLILDAFINIEWLLFAVLAVIVLVPIFYSYLIYKRKSSKIQR
jgi:uncharacterized membrane protein